MCVCVCLGGSGDEFLLLYACLNVDLVVSLLSTGLRVWCMFFGVLLAYVGASARVAQLWSTLSCVVFSTECVCVCVFAFMLAGCP
jgi:hypothetical protein